MSDQDDTKRLDVRVTDRQHAIIKEAATLDQRSLSSFVAFYSLKAAQAIIEDERMSGDAACKVGLGV